LYVDINMSQRLLNSYFRSIGSPDDTFIESYVASSEYKNSSLNFTILIQINNKIDEVSQIAESFVNLFKDSFIDTDKKWFDRFEDAIFNCNEFLLDVCDRTLLSKNDFNILITGCVDDRILFAKANFAEVFLLRDNNLRHLSEEMFVDQDSELLFSTVASGNLVAGDRFLITSQRIQRYLALKNIHSILANTEEADVMDVFEQNLKSDLQNRVGFLLLASCSDIKSHEKEKFSMLEALSKILKGRGFLLDSMTKKNLYLLLVLLFAVLIFGSYVSFTRVVELKQMNSYNAMLDEARLIVNTAKSQTDKSRSAFTLKSAEQKLDKLDSVKSLSKQISNLRDEIASVYSSLDNVKLYDDPEILVDLDQNYPGQTIRDLAVINGSLNVYTNNFALEVLSDFIKDPVSYPSKVDVEMSAFMPDLDSMMLYSNKNDLFAFQNNSLDSISADLDLLSQAASMVAYGRRLYTVNPKQAQIYKYQRVRNSLSNPSPYFASEVDELKNAQHIAIDGSIYVSFSDGSIQQYYQGQVNEFFKLESQPLTEVAQIDDIFTDFDHDYFYVLESDNHRIVRFYKQNDGDLSYIDQLSFPDVRNAERMFVDYNSGKIYLASEKKVYLIPLNL